MLAKHGCRLIAVGIAYADSRQVRSVGRFAWHAAKSTVCREMADPMQALTDRPDQWGQIHRPTAPEAARRTFAFIDFALRKASASD